MEEDRATQALARSLGREEGLMPLATPCQYAAMLDAAADGGYGYAAINVTSSET